MLAGLVVAVIKDQIKAKKYAKATLLLLPWKKDEEGTRVWYYHIVQSTYILHIERFSKIWGRRSVIKVTRPHEPECK